ncbi:hypothetical protein [Streptomyces sp. NPDC057496]|uniref:hypothetical protein n=1 Tax=Streptomyces sp. NPDC057496 TaxID=3346149 RepID=UPI0036A549E8
MKRCLAPVAGLLLVLAGASAAAASPAEPAAPAAATQPRQAPDGPVVVTQGGTGSSSVSIQHANYCDNFVNYGTSWRANCNVDYGSSGSWTQCSDGTEIWGPLVGPGYWIFGGSCSGHGSVRDWGVYDG